MAPAGSPKTLTQARKPTCFISYSTREAHASLLIEAAFVVFSCGYDIKVTPSALTSGASQLNEIVNSLKSCAFAIIVLDGLRPNVIFEYGLAHAFGRPVLLLKESTAEVDIRSFFKDTPDLKLVPVAIDLDSQFSNVKDLNFVKWNRYSLKETCATLWDEYRKKKSMIKPFVDIPEPKLW